MSQSSGGGGGGWKKADPKLKGVTIGKHRTPTTFQKGVTPTGPRPTGGPTIGANKIQTAGKQGVGARPIAAGPALAPMAATAKTVAPGQPMTAQRSPKPTLVRDPATVAREKKEAAALYKRLVDLTKEVDNAKGRVAEGNALVARLEKQRALAEAAFAKAQG